MARKSGSLFVNFITWKAGHLGLEHLEGDDIDEHDPDGRVQHLTLVLHQRDGGDALQDSITQLEFCHHTRKAPPIIFGSGFRNGSQFGSRSEPFHTVSLSIIKR